MWKNIVALSRPQLKIWHTLIACWIHKATNTHPKACWIPKARNTHPEYVILINFALQLWLHECASMLHYTYIACLRPHTSKQWLACHSVRNHAVIYTTLPDLLEHSQGHVVMFVSPRQYCILQTIAYLL